MKFTIKYEIEISKPAFELLKEIKRKGCVEYKDCTFKDLVAFKASAMAHEKPEEWFLKRNNNGTYHLIKELEANNLVELTMDAWYTTYETTWRGDVLIEQYKE